MTKKRGRPRNKPVLESTTTIEEISILDKPTIVDGPIVLGNIDPETGQKITPKEESEAAFLDANSVSVRTEEEINAIAGIGQETHEDTVMVTAKTHTVEAAANTASVEEMDEYERLVKRCFSMRKAPGTYTMRRLAELRGIVPKYKQDEIEPRITKQAKREYNIARMKAKGRGSRPV